MDAYATFDAVPAACTLVFQDSLVTDEPLVAESKDGPWVTFVDPRSQTGYRYLCCELLQHWANQIFGVHEAYLQLLIVETPLQPTAPLMPHTNTLVSPANLLRTLASFFRHEDWYDNPGVGLVLAEMCCTHHGHDREALTFIITEVLWYFYAQTMAEGGLIQHLFQRKQPRLAVHNDGATTPLSLQQCMLQVWTWLTSLGRKSSRDTVTPLLPTFTIPGKWLKKHQSWCPFTTQLPQGYLQFMQLHATLAPLLALGHQTEQPLARAAPLARWPAFAFHTLALATDGFDRHKFPLGLLRTLTMALTPTPHLNQYALLYYSQSLAEALTDQWRWESSEGAGAISSVFRDTETGLTVIHCPWARRRIDYFADVQQVPDVLVRALQSGLEVVGVILPGYGSLYVRRDLLDLAALAATDAPNDFVHYWLNRDVMLNVWQELSWEAVLECFTLCLQAVDADMPP
jgi:hypothetical protein